MPPRMPAFSPRRVAPSPARLPRASPSACRTCGLPESVHTVDRSGQVKPNAWARARLGDSTPPVCWTKEMGRGDVYFPKAFQKRVVAPERVRQVYGRRA